MTIPIFSSELLAAGIRGAQWQVMSFRERKIIATRILSQRADARSRQNAQLLEINNPNAVAGLRLVLDTPGR